jgi:pimeloyl-ACP methyl ester carboxylesterase
VSVDRDPEWDLLGAAEGVRLRSLGTGTPLVVLPGMEGDGTSCLHVVRRVWRDLQRRGPVRLVLVDYGEEQHPDLAELEATVVDLLHGVVDAPAIVWGQSFGCLLAASTARAIRTERLVLVSPFTSLPRSRGVAAGLLPCVPRPLYRATATPVCRWVFGPARGQEGAAFLATLRAADPGDVARRAGWLRRRDHRSHFDGLLGGDAAVWFGVRDRLIDLPAQLEVFTELMTGERSPELVPYAGHVVLPAPSVDFLCARATSWLSA